MEFQHFETQAVRTRIAQTPEKEHASPLFLTSSFTFDSAEEGAAIFQGQQSANLYSRFSNPNTDEFIRKLCLMEEVTDGVATASGMAAVFTSFAALLSSGDHVIACKSIFGNSSYILSNILIKWGIDVTYVDIENKEAWKNAVQPNSKMLFVESPANPTLKIADLAFLGQLCKENNLIFSVDNCFATPYLQKPSQFGADLIIHSATKYIDGQGRVLGGAILGSKELISPCYDFIRRTGASLSPFNAWVLSKSLETLAVRMDRHCSNALQLARYLEVHDEIKSVSYPFLKNNPQAALAQSQMTAGGGLVGCELKGDDNRGAAFLNALKMHSLTANLGDTRSIATQPASTTHSKLSSDEQLAAGISPHYLRFSVGLEHIDDIIKDIEQALNLTSR